MCITIEFFLISYSTYHFMTPYIHFMTPYGAHMGKLQCHPLKFCIN